MGADKLPAQQGDVESKPDINAEVFTVAMKKKRKRNQRKMKYISALPADGKLLEITST